MPATVEFVDIAGLVKGASQGEGLGNQFLANIREVDAIVHVVRCFEDDDIQHVMGPVDPVRDREIINIELGLADLASGGEAARQGRPDRQVGRRPGEDRGAAARGRARRPGRRPARARRDAHRGGSARPIASFNLLTAKPVLYAANVAEDEIAAGNAHVEALRAALAADGRDRRDRPLLRQGRGRAGRAAARRTGRSSSSRSGLTESGLDRLAHAAYHLLGLQSYFTAGEKEVRAWTIHRGDQAPAAAGVIHSDFEKGFIRAETVAYDDFVRVGGWKPAREQGLARAEGKEYVVRDGDVMLFRFSS